MSGPSNKHHPIRRDLWTDNGQPWTDADWKANIVNHPLHQSAVNVDKICGINHKKKYEDLMGENMAKYIKHVNHSWTGVKGTKNPKAKGKHPSPMAADPQQNDITIVFSNGDERQEKRITPSTNLKTLLHEYAEGCGQPVRSLRFSLNGSTLFLSSLGRKTAKDLNVTDLDEITVINIQNLSLDTNPESAKHSKQSSKDKKKHSNIQKSHKKKKRGIEPILALVDSDDKLKENHSVAMSKVFEEAEPMFKSIRQMLNNLTLERRKPKTKRSHIDRKRDNSVTSFACNPNTFGLGGKAGKSSYTVNVGQVDNLYKSSKRNSVNSKTSKQRICFDLHGCTQDQAVERLDEALIDWVDTAMKGQYPWVIPVDIVCGGGNQILSETVETWIKSKTNVANAPTTIQ